MSKDVKFLEIVGSEKQKEVMKEICEKSCVVIKNEYNIKIGKPNAILPIVYAFLQQTVAALNEMKEVDSEVSLSLFDIIEMGITHVTDEDDEGSGNYTPMCAPGVQFKLDAKNDEDNKEALDDDDEE